jgi:heme exporter protein D
MVDSFDFGAAQQGQTGGGLSLIWIAAGAVVAALAVLLVGGVAYRRRR